jgi:hypothetical protein
LTSDNINLDTIQELVDSLELLQTGLDALIVNDVTTGGTTKALSAQQGVVLKGLIDGLTSSKENLSNKATTITGNESSNTVYLTAKAIYDWAVGLFTPKTRTITINGLAQDLSSDRSWTIVTASATWTNVVKVNSVADLPVASSGNRTFLAGTVYYFSIGSFSDANTWTLQNGTTILGFGKTSTTISYTGTGNFLNYTNANVLIRDVELQCATGTLFNVTNTSSFSTYVEQSNFRSCLSLGTILGGGLFLQWTLAISCTTGITASGATGSIILDTSSFRAMSGGANSYAVRILTGTTGTSFRSYNSIFDVSTNHYGVWIQGTYVLSASGVLKGNIFSGTGAVANRVSGVNGNTAGWTISYGENAGIAGLQFSDVDVISTADATFANTAGTFVEGTTIRGYIMSLATYDPLATTMEAKVEALMTSNEASIQVGVRSLTAGANIGGLKTAVVPGALGSVDSDYVAITPNRVYNAYYVKTSNTGGNVVTRFALKMRIKTY